MLNQALQLLLSLSILVVLHEAGHFLPARWFKTRVEKFYLFFDAGFALFKFKKGDTEYGIGWLPLGGYVKISGMIDESMDKGQLNSEPQPWEFRSKPAWQRLIIMLGGVTVNLVLGFLIYMMVMGVWGQTIMPVKNAVNGFSVDSMLYEYGLQDGDNILTLDGVTPSSAEKINKSLFLNGIKEVGYERNGVAGIAVMPDDLGQQMLNTGSIVLISPRIPTFIDTMAADSPLKEFDILTDDQLTAVNGTPTPYFDMLADVLQTVKGEDVKLTIIRNGQSKNISAHVDTLGRLGFRPRSAMKILGSEHIDYSFLESFGAGYNLGVEKLTDYVVSIRFIFSSAGVKQMGGFGAIGGMFNPGWDWEGFWVATAFLSLILAFMNILPIPALDGGHVMFLLYEIITGKAPPQKFMEIAQMLGMLLLLTLVLYANGNDVWKWISG
ncbi:MAG: RIP metalloprotease RseP [Flavobacteriales bacterium]|jgi:regulator of sigma E protease